MSDWFKPEVVLQLIGMLAIAVAAYYAIRIDLKVMHERIDASDKLNIEKFSSHDKRVTAVERDVRHLIFGHERRNHKTETENG